MKEADQIWSSALKILSKVGSPTHVFRKLFLQIFQLNSSDSLFPSSKFANLQSQGLSLRVKGGKKAAALKGSTHQQMLLQRMETLFKLYILFWRLFNNGLNTLKLQHEFVHDVTTLVGIVFRSANHWAQWFINGFWSGNH